MATHEFDFDTHSAVYQDGNKFIIEIGAISISMPNITAERLCLNLNREINRYHDRVGPTALDKLDPTPNMEVRPWNL